jgi:signal transduction histidine kinase
MTVTASAIAMLVCVVVATIVLVTMRGRETDYRKGQISDAALRVVYLVKKNRLPAVLPPDGVSGLQVLNASGKVISASHNLVGRPPIASFRPAVNRVTGVQTRCPPPGLDGCMYVVAFTVYQPDGDWTVYAAGGRVEWYVSSTLVGLLAGLCLLLVALTAVGTARIAARVLAPVEAIRAELAEITATDIDRRVPLPRNQDEIRRLAETVNATLDRLDAALEQLRRFTSDASHDLRSPITALRAQVEEGLLYPDDTDWPRTARAMLASVDRLQSIVTDLLLLARLDADCAQADDTVDLAALITAELDRRPRDIQVIRDLRSGITVLGDPLRLTRLFTNLVDNAERHAASRITVTLRAEADMAVVEVVDDGSGIAVGQREIVFRRFTRLDAARSRDTGGSGLGLPIARQIAEAHGGTLTIEDSPRGARFVLHIPRNGSDDVRKQG